MKFLRDQIGSSEVSLARYLTLREQRPDYFRDPVESPIAILTTMPDIAAAQAEEAKRQLSFNTSPPDLRVGVLASDPYLGMLTRDAVRFADGSLGLYVRHIGVNGCVVMPMFDGKIGLIQIFRHAVRDWAWELPGGRVTQDSDPAEAARSELEEEIGAVNPVVISLGSLTPYPAFSSALVHMFTATVDAIGAPQTAEGIRSVELVSPTRLLDMVDNGDITDATAISCIMKARLRGII